MKRNENILKVVLTLIISVAAHFSCFSQLNLVPNPGFENFSNCPYYEPGPSYSGANAICLATPWFQPDNPNASPSDFNCGESSSDFYHICAGNIPIVWSGFDYQYPVLS